MARADADRLAAWSGMRGGVARSLREIEARLEEERGIDLGTYGVLEALVEAGGRMRVSDLADALVLGRPTTSRTCDRVESAGLVRRERPAGDARAVDIVITRAGREEYRRCQPAYERLVQDAFGGRVSDADVTTLLRVSRSLSS